MENRLGVQTADLWPAIAIHSLNQLVQPLSSLSYNQVVIITHPSLWSLYGQNLSYQLSQLGWKATTIYVPEGEQNKNLKQAKRCWQHLAAHQVDRQSAILALGGGVICDLAGFVSACYMRGIDSIYLPTTLLAMVDAAIGGKTGINLGKGKNLVGAFHRPRKVIMDPACLTTLPQRDFIAGLAEVIKYGVIDSLSLFELIEQQGTQLLQREAMLLERVIRESCSIKQKFVEADYQDRTGMRAQLNYGHTFGHAIESLTNYKQYLHGEAVAIGMSCAAHVSLSLGMTDQETVRRQDHLCQQMGLPIQLPPISLDRLIACMKGDKKASAGKINLILPEKIGKVSQASHVCPCEIKQALLKKQ